MYQGKIYTYFNNITILDAIGDDGCGMWLKTVKNIFIGNFRVNNCIGGDKGALRLSNFPKNVTLINFNITNIDGQFGAGIHGYMQDNNYLKATNLYFENITST